MERGASVASTSPGIRSALYLQFSLHMGLCEPGCPGNFAYHRMHLVVESSQYTHISAYSTRHPGDVAPGNSLVLFVVCHVAGGTGSSLPACRKHTYRTGTTGIYASLLSLSVTDISF